MSFIHRISADNCHLTADQIGSKALSLCKMLAHGMNVPPAFVFETELFRLYENNRQLPESFMTDLRFTIQDIEIRSQKKFGDKDNPLYVSVRSGAAASMPGMMDSFLNIGMVEDNLKTSDEYKRYINFIKDYAALVHQIYLEELLEDSPEHGLEDKSVLQNMIKSYLACFEQQIGEVFPQDPFEQLRIAVITVLKSVHNRRAKTYRMLHDISKNEVATAVIIQQMVLGDMVGFSGSGVAVSRDPNTGQLPMMGEFVLHHQGEMLVGGAINPEKIALIKAHDTELFTTLEQHIAALEIIYEHPVEVEFTIENGTLWFLQVRPVKTSDEALVNFVVQMFEANHMTADKAIAHVPPKIIERFLHDSVDPDHKQPVLDTGVGASPGAACGQVVFTADDAIRYHAEGKKVILVRHETSPEDIYGMYAAAGILTARGGLTSHAAVAARGMGRVCVTAVKNIKIVALDGLMMVDKTRIRAGDIITIDGNTGRVFLGEVPLKQKKPSRAFYKLNQMAAKRARMAIRANVDSLAETDIALDFDMSGVGLYRTEYAFYKEEDINNIRRMVLAETIQERSEIADHMRTGQIMHYKNLFKKTRDLPIAVRLLDPPLHEFFPDNPRYLPELAQKLGLSESKLFQRLRDLKEYNPMLGVRGCRVGVLYPEIYIFQIKFILAAAIDIAKETGIYPNIEIMVPFIGFETEFQIIRQQILSTYESAKHEDAKLPPVKIGAVIELPRAALCADQIAKTADFLSFGTNDLTQTVIGISRDDSPRFMTDYMRKRIVPFDPFVKLDLSGVGMLIAIAVEKARKANPDIVIGLCGEHGADPECVDFCEMLGFDYVSCSVFRMFGARLSAAQARIKADANL
ncbi:MAG: pyruvate, phosphate dikinase [Pseudomonadota bacterium]